MLILYNKQRKVMIDMNKTVLYKKAGILLLWLN